MAKQIPHRGWQTLSAGNGSKGERLYQWAYTSVSRGTSTTAGGDECGQPQPGHHRWLLIRHNPHTGELA
ncbi:hypothetical protein EV651_13410 [Kribbella sp. VKM Ac-2571]|uniref:hypothetical protein n=1 Tax=Kribbella sp. VKM Ac-2571 TaxID=2512222 RepID=UPI0010E45C3D|nr:hypothetical protein [Kribbella sp. VKM Ac-2571]TDO44467.1 hypothetical protein EV651_13410 [Kribbella sp. VKM Ac-2571]